MILLIPLALMPVALSGACCASLFVTSDAKAAIYVVSALNERGSTAELVRVASNGSVDRTAIGRNCTYGFSSAAVVAGGDEPGGYRLRTWDLQTGKLLTDCTTPYATLKVLPARTRRGFVPALTIAPGGDVLYTAIRQTEEQKNGVRGRVTVSLDYGSINPATGEAYRVTPPADVVEMVEWDSVREQVGLRLKDGSFAVYSSKSHTVADVERFEGIPRDWTMYFPDIGFARSAKGGVELLSACERPLSHPLLLPYSGNKLTETFRKAEDGHILRFSVDRPVGGRTTLAIHDTTANVELLRDTVSLSATAAFVDVRAEKWLLVDARGKRALAMDRRSRTEVPFAFPWARLPAVVPNFGR